ncbi:MAG: hypothetical protein ABI741_02935 [Ferruginibacter sp.]
MKQYKQYVSDPITIFMCLAAVYLLGFIGVALLYIFSLAQLPSRQEQKISSG